MEFSIHEIHELNKFMSALAEFSDRSGVATFRHIEAVCNSVPIAGRKFNYTRIAAIGAYFGLLARSGNNLALTSEGKKFLSLNTERAYVLTEPQKVFLLSQVFFRGRLSSICGDFFRWFVQDYGRETFVRDLIDRPVPQSLNWLLFLLRKLDVISIQQNLIIVSRKYIVEVKHLIAPKSMLSAEELEKILGAKRKLGELGELIVMNFEKARLLTLQRPVEAELVDRISTIDTAAGFDIKSFNGDSPALDYERFIEVKASSEMNVRFNWSKNEYEVAKIYGNKYWIYFCSSVDQSNPQECHIIMIQNPAKRLKALGFKMEASEYTVFYDRPHSSWKKTKLGNNIEVTII